MVEVTLSTNRRPRYCPSEDGAAVLNLAGQIAEKFGAIQDDFNGFNVLHTAAARVAGLDMGFLPGEGGRDMAGILAGRRRPLLRT